MRNPARITNSLWLVAAILTFWSFGYTMLAAGDLWWHLANGRLIFDSKALPLVDSWSFGPKTSLWLQHEWLADFIYHVWASAFGMASLVYWKWATIIAVFGTLLLVCRRLTNDYAASYIAVVFALIVAAPFLDIRPHLFSLLFYAVLLLIALRDDRPLPVWLPLLFLLWVNLHGGFFFGLMALSVVAVLSSARRKNLRIFMLCTLVCLINPSGWNAFLYPLRYALNQNSPYRVGIPEWSSPFTGGIDSTHYIVSLALFAIAAGFLVWKRQERDRVVLMSLALSVVTMAMSITSRRFIPLYAMSLALTIAPALSHVTAAVLHRVPDYVPAVAALVVGVFLIWPYPKGSSAFHYLTAEDDFPVEVCNFIDVNNLSGDVFAYYNWGGYLHLRTAGRMKVFIDQRADTVFTDDAVLQYHRVQGFKEGWQQILEASGAGYVLWPRDSRGRALIELIQSGRWRMLYDDAVSVLLVRSDLAPSSQPLQTPESGHKHLALAVKSLEQGRYETSEKEFEAAIAMLPASSFACQGLANLRTRQGRTDEALKQQRRCKECFPSF